MDKNEGYIRFDFSPVKHSTSMHYYVLAESLDEMHMFLNQHGFHNVDSSLVFYPIEKYKSTDSAHVLHEYRFMSNHKPGVFTVMTCENFITHAIETTANDLTDASLFGEAILRTDIEIFKVISSLINRLSHGHVIDIQIADESVLYSMENEDSSSRFVWVVYTNNPYGRELSGSDLPYLAHYVSMSGEYLYNLPAKF